MSIRLRVFSALLLIVSGVAAVSTAAAQYPARPIRMLVGFVPGGGTDVVARLLAPKLTEIWGQQVVIDNRPGATGTIAASLVAHAQPDGYTILMGHASTNTVAPNLFAKLPYDPVKAFAPVTLAGSVPHLISVHPSVPAQSLKELLAQARAHPGKLTYPSSGHGAMSHVAGEVFKHMTGTNLLHVPFKGAGLSVQALAAGQVLVSFDTTAAVMPFVKSGRLRALAAATSKRLASLPELPTVAEAGVPGYTMSSWYGVFAPARTPAAIVSEIHAAVNRAQNLPDIKERMEALGTDGARTATPAEFAAMFQAELKRYAEVIKAAGIRIE